jgi:hypothetical protein
MTIETQTIEAMDNSALPDNVERKLYKVIGAEDETEALELIANYAMLIPKMRMYDGDTWLGRAVNSGSLEVCKSLIAKGADVNDPCRLERPLITARPPLLVAVSANKNATEIVTLLLEHHALVDGLAISCCTPLMSAAINGKIEVARLLLAAGADVNRQHGNWTKTALDLAENWGHADVAALLRQHGGVRLESAQRDWSKEWGGETIGFVEETVGQVSPLALSQIVPGDLEINIRFAQIRPKKEYKLLFTIGVSVFADLELALCLPKNWPITGNAAQEPQYAWPVQLFLNLAVQLNQGRSLAAGTILSRDDAALHGLLLPAELSSFLVTDVASTDLDNLMVLVPLYAKDKINTPVRLQALLEKKRQAKWKALCVLSAN